MPLRTSKYGSKSIQTSLILRQRPPKSYKLLKYFMISVILFKMCKHSDFHLIFFQVEVAWQDSTVVTKLIKNFKSLYGKKKERRQLQRKRRHLQACRVHGFLDSVVLFNVICSEVVLTLSEQLKLERQRIRFSLLSP